MYSITNLGVQGCAETFIGKKHPRGKNVNLIFMFGGFSVLIAPPLKEVQGHQVIWPE